MNESFAATHALILRRQSKIFVEAGNSSHPGVYLDAIEVNLAKLGYAVSTRLRQRFQSVPIEQLTRTQSRVWSVLATQIGGNQTHTPLFRRFPDDVPDDTFGLWCKKVLSHFMQAEGQPCLHCRQTGSTHVLNPCRHVVCDTCFDGSNYSACPVCEHAVDRSSAFFKPLAPRSPPQESRKFKLLDLGDSLDQAAQDLFISMCERKQAMSPADVDDFKVLIGDYGVRVLPWLPADIPVRESVAHVFGTLLQTCAPALVMDSASQYLSTATDVLRLLAAFSDADPALQGQTVWRKREVKELQGIARFKHMFLEQSQWRHHKAIDLPVMIKRFKLKELSRALRRTLLGFMESLRSDSLIEDMLRHRSYWVWVGEFLHPGEYKKRFPQVALAFEIVRRKSADGNVAPDFQTYYAKLEMAVIRRDSIGLTRLLSQRPGELARRFDHALRVAGSNAEAIDALLTAFVECAPSFSTPVLLTLFAMLPTRAKKAKVRIYWPKGQVSKGVFQSDERAPLSIAAIRRAMDAIEAELIGRFSDKPKFDEFVIDVALKDIVAPFNERTASRSAIQLPRGSTLAVPPMKNARLFLHWCEPEKGGHSSDLDLSVGLYDAEWRYQGTCSYYQLTYAAANGDVIAKSAGDLRDAPFPEGASEFIDLDCQLALRQGIRYAVAVVNNYSGMAFGDLEHAFAGLMFREDMQGAHFDPRSVDLKFDLQGGNGIYLPMVFDLEYNRIHWLDVYSSGEFEFNNVASSNSAIRTICPAMISYFASGVRATMFDLALLHAAARGRRVVFRGVTNYEVERVSGEDNLAFLQRLRIAENSGGIPGSHAIGTLGPTCALLIEGDLELPAGSSAYALKKGVTATTLAASDLL